MLRLAFLVAVSFALSSSAALAQVCTYSAGEYVDVDPLDPVVPAIVIEAGGDPCYVTVRVLAVPGQPFDPYTPAYFAEYISPLVGAPPYDKPYGCPYAPGDAVDLRDQYGNWYPGRVTSSDRYCGYAAEYWMGLDLKTYGAIDSDLRPPTLAPPTEGQLAAAEEAALEAMFCPPGGTAADYPGDDVEAMMRRGVVAEISRNMYADAHVRFDSVRAGETSVATEGTMARTRNPDASVGSTIYPFRLQVTVCVSAEPIAELSRFALDYTCYTDIFGDFACRRDAGRPID
jgi:hypothetical protein